MTVSDVLKLAGALLLGLATSACSADHCGSLSGDAVPLPAPQRRWSPGFLASDADFLYVGNTSGNVARISKDPAGTSSVIAGAVDAGGVVVDETRLFYVNRNENVIMSIAKKGGAAMLLASARCLDSPLLADADRLYCVETDTLVSVNKDGSDLKRASFSTATSTNTVDFPAVGPELVYLTVSGDDAARLVALPKRGGAARTLDTADIINGVLVDGEFLYWVRSTAMSNDGATQIARSGLDGSHVQIVANGTSELNGPLAADEDCFYAWSGTTVWRVAKAGGTLEGVNQAVSPFDMVVDDAALYWTDLDQSTVFRIDK